MLYFVWPGSVVGAPAPASALVISVMELAELVEEMEEMKFSFHLFRSRYKVLVPLLRTTTPINLILSINKMI